MNNYILPIIDKKIIKRFISVVLSVVMVLGQVLVVHADSGAGDTRRVKSEEGCKHNCWFDDDCQEILDQIFDTNPKIYDEIAEKMEAYDFDSDDYGPGVKTDSNAKEKPDYEEDEGNPAGGLEWKKATDSDAEGYKETATSSNAESCSPKYKITEDGRLILKSCRHKHDDFCGYYAWKSSYTFEDDEISVKATVISGVETALPEGSNLVVEKITDPDEQDMIAQKIAFETGGICDSSQIYDIHFESGGEEVEPESAKVKIRLKYKHGAAVNVPDDGKGGGEFDGVRVLHLTDDDQVEDVTGEISRNFSGDLKEANFETESFSIFVLTCVAPNGNSFRYEDEEKIITASASDASEILAGAKLVVDVIGPEDVRYAAALAGLSSPDGSTGDTDVLIYDYYFTDRFDEKIEVPEDMKFELKIMYKEPKTFGAELKNVEPETYGLTISSETAEEEADTAGPQILLYQVGEDFTVKRAEGSVVTSKSAVESVEVQTFGTGAVVLRNSAIRSYDRYLETGGSYSLAYILQNFNIFVHENVKTGHTIGAVAVGGTSNFDAGIGGVTTGGEQYVHKVPSYFEGKTYIRNLQDGAVKKVYVGEANAASPPNFVGVETYVSVNDEYIDFDDAFSHINKEIAKFQADVVIDRKEVEKVKKGGYWPVYNYDGPYYRMHYVGEDGGGVQVDLKPGYSFQFDSFEDIKIVNVDAEQEKANTLILCTMNAKSLTLPRTFVNGSGNLTGNRENGTGMGIAYLFPNFNGKMEINKGYNSQIGHLVAPNADFDNATGDYNGCLVVKSLTGNAEGHMWPYNGTLLEGGLKLKLGKTVDDEEPGDAEFDFILQEMTESDHSSGIWIENDNIGLEPGAILQTVKNNNREISFDTMSFDNYGDFYYRVYENADPLDENYRYDSSCYYIKISTKKTATKIKVNTVSYWKTDLAEDQVRGKPITVDLENDGSDMVTVDLTKEAVFQNKSKEAASVQFQTGKLVDRKTPQEGQKFKFVLQTMRTVRRGEKPEAILDGFSLVTDSSKVPDEKQNEGGTVTFDSISYEKPGTYFYQIYEMQKEDQLEDVRDDYLFDKTGYYIKVVVAGSGKASGIDRVTYWKSDSAGIKKLGEMIQPDQVINLSKEIVFYNKKNLPVVLPETGSVGTGNFSYTGFWLFMIGACGLMFLKPERSRKIRRK